ncbi:MAG TPA: mechanosensitive ion channel family protein [Terriglobales bacterium]|nr:mechanosensitive ion channel family protein [Terriglobales bacterium]
MPTLFIHALAVLPTDFWRDWQQDFSRFVRDDLPKVGGVLIEAIVLLLLLRAITHRLTAFAERQTLPSHIRAQQLRTVASLARSAGGAIIVFLAIMQILDAVHINIGPLLASAGVAGLAIGFGAQTLVHDVITGFFVLMENQYDLGDTVRVGGVKGTVELMTLRRTVLRDADGAVHTIPNSQITIVSNLTRDWTQVTLHIAVAYDQPTDKVISVLKEAASEVRTDPAFSDAIVADPEVPGIERVAGGEVDYLVAVKTRPADQFRVSRELRRRIKLCFEKNNIRAAGPGRVYVVDKPTTEGGS